MPDGLCLSDLYASDRRETGGRGFDGDGDAGLDSDPACLSLMPRGRRGQKSPQVVVFVDGIRCAMPSCRNVDAITCWAADTRPALDAAAMRSAFSVGSAVMAAAIHRLVDAASSAAEAPAASWTSRSSRAVASCESRPSWCSKQSRWLRAS